MTETSVWIAAVRSSHDRFALLVRPLDAQAVQAPSYDDDWTIAQVASHLGSQAEIFTLFLQAGLAGDEPPGGEVFPPIWDRWNALPPEHQVSESVATNEEFVRRLEGLSESERAKFSLSLFGSQLDLAGLAGLRLGEHAVHTWDVAVALDPTATVAPDAVELLLDTLDTTAARSGKPSGSLSEVVIETSAPQRRYLLTAAPEVALAPDTGSGPATVELPGEALLRLVYGRLDPDHTPAQVVGADTLEELRQVFPGF
jgi:uncharacterized protein (TIGR03083 family)